ncbi:unnamed protein product [Brachionus calyciflorus]|uniref:Costars domain-containing protein n=1 Tax=Brachionus calyciflorus TaxID=104777 RepID=A0A813ST42_9BILA|nr:unnamed protein product [Brachionus calyciflorus]
MNLSKNYFNNLIKQNEEKQRSHAFSSNWDNLKSNRDQIKLKKDDPNYGIPINKLTLKRGLDAHNHISNEILELIQVIRENGEIDEDGLAYIKFGRLFEIYNTISNKVVGLLLRARKNGLVDFKGEMLFQRRDDLVVIKVLKENNINSN